MKRETEIEEGDRMGKLYGIGVGPGDPELLTLKAHRLLQEADVIFCPQKKKGADSSAFDIVRPFLEERERTGRGAEVVSLIYPMHYHGAQLRQMWEENAVRIAGYLEGERNGVFITLGDPAVYSTFMYTLPYLEKRGIPVEVVPGIPSFCAAADSVKWPLAAWDEDLLIVPVRKNSGKELGEIIRNHDNVILMKPSSDREALLQALEANAGEKKFVLISKSGRKEERRLMGLEEIKTFEIPYLSVILVKNAETSGDEDSKSL